jgi:hypothetical protein
MLANVWAVQLGYPVPMPVPRSKDSVRQDPVRKTAASAKIG